MRTLTDASTPAGFFPRAAAYLLDRLILLLPQSLIALPLLFAAVRSGKALTVPFLFDMSLSALLCWIVQVVYFTLFTWRGSTPGKRALNLTVVMEDGSRPGFGKLLYRESVGRYLSSLLNIGYLLVLADGRRQALHDMICDTQVIYTVKLRQEAPAAPAAAPWRQPEALKLVETADPEKDWYRPYRV